MSYLTHTAVSPTDQQRLEARLGEPVRPAWTVGWREAIFEHYRIINLELIERLLPNGLTLDQDADGDSWLSVVSFKMTNMRWRNALRLPFAATYPQVNIRVYVSGLDGTPGVFFLRNLVANRLAAIAGRILYGMPYVYQPATLDSDAASFSCEAELLNNNLVHAVAGRSGDLLTGYEDNPSMLLFFLTERYPMYSLRQGRLYVARMAHPPWPLRRLFNLKQSHGAVKMLELYNALDPYKEVHCSSGVQVQMWPARRFSAF